MRVACGASHSLAVSEDGQIFAWGKNSQGQCGVGTYFTPHSSSNIYPNKIIFLFSGTTEDIHTPMLVPLGDGVVVTEVNQLVFYI